jgi:hypothetical protein
MVREMAAASPMWGAPWIHGDLRTLGVRVSERTVSRLLERRSRPRSQTWRTFFPNHLASAASMDFSTVPTLTGRVLFVLVVLPHQCRRMVHVNIAYHPTAMVCSASGRRVAGRHGAPLAARWAAPSAPDNRSGSNRTAGPPSSSAASASTDPARRSPRSAARLSPAGTASPGTPPPSARRSAGEQHVTMLLLSIRYRPMIKLKPTFVAPQPGEGGTTFAGGYGGPPKL